MYWRIRIREYCYAYSCRQNQNYFLCKVCRLLCVQLYTNKNQQKKKNKEQIGTGQREKTCVIPVYVIVHECKEWTISKFKFKYAIKKNKNG